MRDNLAKEEKKNSWNKDLARKRGIALGGENRRKGVNVMLGPVVGPAWTVVKGGRNWEGSSADPYLSGVLAAETVQGVQSQNVMTSVKVCHPDRADEDEVSDGSSITLAMSRSSTARWMETSRPCLRTLTTRRCTSCIYGVYLFSKKAWACCRNELIFCHRPFVDLVKAGAANVMCSYNRLNQTYACGNSKTLNGILKTELGFQVREAFAK